MLGGIFGDFPGDVRCMNIGLKADQFNFTLNYFFSNNFKVVLFKYFKSFSYYFN